jgi:2,4-diaminopentanoate dehydrogenase
MSKSKPPYRIIVWATGAVGKYAIRATARHPDFELVGTLVYSSAKAGKDAGDIAGIAPLGVRATTSKEDIFAMPADCVFYAPLMSDIEDILKLLESGKNVVTPTGFSYVRDRALLARINAACAKGGVSFHGSGIHPGFTGDRLPLVLSAMCERIDKITVYEVADMSDHDESVDMIKALGFFMSAEEAAKSPPVLLPVMSTIFREGMQMVAAGLGFEIDDFKTTHEFAIAARDIQAACGTIRKGQVGGQHFSYKGFSKGRLVCEYQTYWKMSPDALEPNWAFDKTLGYTIDIEGAPSLRCTFETVGGRPAELGLHATAMNVFNAVPLVIQAAPGMKTALDLPLITGYRTVRA